MLKLLLLLLLTQEGGMSAIHDATQRNVWVETNGHVGSGVIIQTGVVLTCFHILETDSVIEVDHKAASIIAVDPVHDLVLLAAETKTLPRVKLANKVEVYDPVFYVGNTNGHKNYTSTGRITFTDDKYLYSDTTAVEGCSGGGLYNMAGELIGLTVQQEYHVIALHIRAKVVSDFLNSHKEFLK